MRRTQKILRIRYIIKRKSHLNLNRYLTTRSLHNSPNYNYDVIVVGGGHAGTEAACASARMGAKTLLATHKFETVGEMSCNPSFGGVGKGHLMREIDALDGVCSRVCDQSGLQYRMLNRARGPAVWGPRAQIDRDLYKKCVQQEILATKNLELLVTPVEDLILGEATHPDTDKMKQTCHGVVLGNGDTVYAKTVILTAGTFLRGTINIGLSVRPAGRMGDQPAIGLAKSIEDAGFRMGRLKTGTPPRLDGRTIDYSKITSSSGDREPQPFSFLNEDVWLKPEDQMLCHLTQTNAEVDKVVMETIHLNKHVKEEINGPRFCPSLESKVLRFKGREHQIWLEPEGFNSNVVYPNGISCTMPEEDQLRLLRCIRGLESVDIVKPGYGVEYDFMDPRQLKPSLETLRIQNLFFAGQINGTTGYEEAAAQGLIAGINAALKVQNKSPFVMDRTEGYIGVLIDDLTTQGTNEPYRMFTSRSEFRLTLRPDNADFRLTEKGYKAGCVSERRYQKTKNLKSDLEDGICYLKDFKKTVNKWRKDLDLPTNRNVRYLSAFDMIAARVLTLDKATDLLPEDLQRLYLNNKLLRSKLYAEALYSSQLEEQLAEINEVKRDEQLSLPEDINFYSLDISTDAKVKLDEARPATIAAASRIPGITPAAIIKLLKYVKVAQNKNSKTSRLTDS